MRQSMILILVCLALTGCAASIQSDKGTFAESVIAECQPPIDLPEGAMTFRDIEKYWSQDRYSLIECKGKHKELIKTLQDRDIIKDGTE